MLHNKLPRESQWHRMMHLSEVGVPTVTIVRRLEPKLHSSPKLPKILPWLVDIVVLWVSRSQ